MSIDHLEADTYWQHHISRYFPSVERLPLAARCIEMAHQQGVGVAIQNLRQSLLSS